MDRFKIIIASVLFVLLTAVKMLLPAQMDMLRAAAARFTAEETDYRAAVTAIGRSLSDRDLGEKLIAVFREYAAEETERGE